MRAFCYRLFRGNVGLLLALISTWNVFGQSIPVVTIQATQPIASKVSGQTGTFTVFRAGDTNFALNIYYRISGTASNGVDYDLISNWAFIPAGVSSNSITITPINVGQSNVQTVILQLAPSPELTPINYTIGTPDTAEVYIESSGPNGTNLPPDVAITTPTDGSVFDGPTNIQIIAEAGDPDGYITSMEFFANGISLGVETNGAIIDPLAGQPNPYREAFFLTWSNVAPGSYTLTAKATDNGGASTISDPVDISVVSLTNLPPVVRIVSPPNNAMFRTPVNIPIFAYAHDFAGSISNVEFFAGSQDLGPGRGFGILPGPIPLSTSSDVIIFGPIPTPFPPIGEYFLIWSNALPGMYPLTAVATDDSGVSSTSAPVDITILPPPPPLTNLLDIVTITATDPMAVETTNCWVWPGVTNATPTWAEWPTAIRYLFTNCGPKNAGFTVRRHGSTNDDLTVTYATDGTASNGVDYVTLPGSVLIPAGERDGLITIVPIDVGPTNSIKTVILTLTPSTNAPPDYLVGVPRRAAAVILDGIWPRPWNALLPDRCFHLGVTGPDGAWFHVDCSTNMVDWVPLCTNQVVEGSIDFVDPNAQDGVNRFYRAVPEANPPQ